MIVDYHYLIEKVTRDDLGDVPEEDYEAALGGLSSKDQDNITLALGFITCEWEQGHIPDTDRIKELAPNDEMTESIERWVDMIESRKKVQRKFLTGH